MEIELISKKLNLSEEDINAVFQSQTTENRISVEKGGVRAKVRIKNRLPVVVISQQLFFTREFVPIAMLLLL